MAIEIQIENRSIVQLKQDLISLRTQLAQTTNPDIIKQFEAEITKVNEAIVQQAQSYDAAGKSVSVLRKEFKVFQDLASEATDTGSEGFQALARASGQARDGIQAVNEQINQFAAGTQFEQAQLQIGGIKQGLLSLDFDKVSESAANLSNTIKSAGSLKAVFGDIGGAVKNLGSVFSQVGKALLANPIFLLATVIGVIIIALVAFLDKVGLLKKAIELTTLPLKLLMGLLTSITDALGLTAEAQKAYAATTIKEGEKIRAEIDRQEKQQLAFYNVTKNLTDQQIADLQKRTGVVIDTTKSEFDIRQNALDDRIAQNEKEIAALEAIGESAAGLTEDEQKQLDERLKQQQEFKDQSIQIELDRTARIAELNRGLNDQLDKIRAQNITNEADRNKALNELDKQAAISRIDAQIAELKRLGQDTTNAEALRAETITFYANKETQIRRDANKKALGEAQKRAQDALQVIQDEEELKIARTEEGTAAREMAEIAAGQRILEFQRKNAKLLGLSSTELAIIEEENNKRVEESAKRRQEVITESVNATAILQKELAVATAKTQEERLQAEIALIQKRAEIEKTAIETASQARLAAASGDKALTDQIIAETQAALANLEAQTATAVTNASNLILQNAAETAAKRQEIEANAAAFDLQNLATTFEQRRLLTEQFFIQQNEALIARREADLIAAGENETRKLEIEEQFRQQSLALEKQKTDQIKNLKYEEINAVLDAASNGLNSIASLSNLVLDIESQNLKEGSKEAEAAAKKKFEVNKAFQLGAAIIDGFKAVNTSLAQSPIAIGPIPNPAGIASLAFAIATSVANVVKIASQQYKPKGGGGGAAPAGAGAAGAVSGAAAGAGSVVPQVNLFGAGNNANTATATPQTQTQQAPPMTVKAIVVESDITQTQRNVSRIETAAEL